MKTIEFNGTRDGDNLLHIEAPGCIVNIHIKLTDRHGRKVTRVDVKADNYADDRWHLPDFTSNPADPSRGIGVRVVQGEPLPTDEQQPDYKAIVEAIRAELKAGIESAEFLRENHKQYPRPHNKEMHMQQGEERAYRKLLAIIDKSESV